MSKSQIFSILVMLLLAGSGATYVAMRAADYIEQRSRADVTEALAMGDHGWVAVYIDGLRVEMTGEAADEASRFRAINAVNKVVDAERVIDNMEVADSTPIAAPDFSIEILRNSTGISLIGLVPKATDRAGIITSMARLNDSTRVTDMLDFSDFPSPDGWDAALAFGLDAVRDLPKSKVSITATQVAVTAISSSVEEKRKIETELADNAPRMIRLITHITAPRPVISPFTLRFIINGETVRFDACSADNNETHATIIKAALAAGLKSETNCTIGLGVPSTSWGEAVTVGIGALHEIGGGTITFSDADVTLIASDSTSQATFDRVIGELDAALPKLFSLHGVLPDPVIIDGSGDGEGPPEFVATLSPEGQVQIRGRVTDQRTRDAVGSYARARFGSAMVDTATILDPDLPNGWPLRVLAGIEVLAELHNGSVIVQENFVELHGVTGNLEANANIARLLSEKLGASADYGIEVKYERHLDPVAGLLKPAECVGEINQILAKRKISFGPGSAELDDAGQAVVDEIAGIVKRCHKPKIEIAGHTDSQGREIMNQRLSKDRADAVLQGLMARRILTVGLHTMGYGESVPIADNKTEDGRETNRRIEFTLVLPEPSVQEPVEHEKPEINTSMPAASVVPLPDGEPDATAEVNIIIPVHEVTPETKQPAPRVLPEVPSYAPVDKTKRPSHRVKPEN